MNLIFFFFCNLNPLFYFIIWINILYSEQDRGISSNGRAPAQHAGGTGIDTRILQIDNNFFLYVNANLF